MVGELNYKDAAFSILDDMIYKGSVPAEHRKADLEQLDGMVKSLLHNEQREHSNRLLIEAINSQIDYSNQPAISSSMEATQVGWQLSWNNMENFYPAQMDSIAQALGSYNTGAGINDDSIDQWLWNQRA